MVLFAIFTLSESVHFDSKEDSRAPLRRLLRLRGRVLDEYVPSLVTIKFYRTD